MIVSHYVPPKKGSTRVETPALFNHHDSSTSSYLGVESAFVINGYTNNSPPSLVTSASNVSPSNTMAQCLPLQCLPATSPQESLPFYGWMSPAAMVPLHCALSPPAKSPLQCLTMMSNGTAYLPPMAYPSMTLPFIDISPHNVAIAWHIVSPVTSSNNISTHDIAIK